MENYKSGSHTRHDLKVHLVWNALLSEYTEMRRKFWGQRLWARGYFAASSGNVTDEVVMAYIAGQDQERSDDDFRVGEEPR